MARASIDLVCQVCGVVYNYTSGNGLRKDRCRNCKAVLRFRKRKAALIKLLGGECENCGYSACQAALDFHHNDPDDKEFMISHTKNRSEQELLDELAKCSLLCSNCHRELEYYSWENGKNIPSDDD